MAKKQVDIDIRFKSQKEEMDKIIQKFIRMDTIITKINSNKINIMGSNNTVVINQAIDSVSRLGKKTKQTKKLWDNMFSLAKISGAIHLMRRLTSVVGKVTKESADFIENLNLTEVAFYGNVKAVRELSRTLADVYNLDESAIVRRIGVFKQMANAMGLAHETGEQLAGLMNKMTVDVASLYNIDIERASNALQSALVGQTRPIRGATGADITEKTLERTVGRVLPDRYIRDLSFVEKRLVMVISLTEQLKNSQGDWARTIEAPDNQIRILTEQVTQLGRAMGNLLLPVMTKILPYLNAFLMVTTNIVNALARLVGYELPKFDYSTLTVVSDGAMDLEEQMNNAGTSADRLKAKLSGLRGFDKLNVISTPTSGGGIGGGIGSGVDSRLLDEFARVATEYDDLLDGVTTRASEIADSVLRWLGFEKDLNGEYKFRKITLGTILGTIGGIALLAVPIATVFKLLKGIGLFKGFTTVTTGITGFVKWIGKAIPLVGNLVIGKTKLSTVFGTLFPKLSKVVTGFSKWVVPLAGVAGLVWGSKGVINATKELTKGSENTTKSIGKLGISFGSAVAGGAALGSVIPGVGTAIGAMGGVVVGGVSALIGYNKAVKELASEEVFGTLHVSTQQWTDILNNSLPAIDNYGEKSKELQSKLEGLKSTFDTNSEAMDLYQIKFGQMGQKISAEDAPKIINSVKKMTESTSAMIQENTDYSLSLWGSAFEGMTTLTEEEQKNILNHISNYGANQQKELNTAQGNITKTYDYAIKTRGYLTDAEYKYIQTQLKKIRELTQKEMTRNQAEIEYFKQTSADKNLQLDEQSYKNLAEVLKNAEAERKKIINDNYTEMMNDAERYRDGTLEGEEAYHNQRLLAYEKRNSDILALEEELQDSKMTIFENLAIKYSELTGKMDVDSKEQRKLIESVFKDFDIPLEEVIEKVTSGGKKVGNSFSKGIGEGFNDNKLKFKIPGVPDLGIKQKQLDVIASYNKYNPYQTGGFPKVGELFIANEAGPEVVTTLGGKGVVANMEQMMTYLDRRIDTKLGSGSGKNKQPVIINVQVGNREIGKIALDDLTDMAKSNGKPITIGG